MKTCWEVLGIEYTHDADAIRQAYLALLPSFHPESDPQGFKALRQAYESALQEAKKPAAPVVALDANTQQVNDMLAAFHDLLACDERRFQPAAWQRFIQQINMLSIKQVERLRWSLYAIAQEAWPVSYTCLRLLAERLGWERQDGGEEIDNETLDNFLHSLRRGDLFDYSRLLALPAEVQNQTIAFYAALEGSFFNHPSFFSHFINQHGVTIVPDDLNFQRRLLRWYSSLQWGIPELIPVAKAWREDEPDNTSPQYYEYAQRVYCGEGDSLLPGLCALWKQGPSTQMDNLLLQWCRQNRPDDYPLVVLAVERHEQRDSEGEELAYFHGTSARTRLLWAEALHSGILSPLSRCFVTRVLQNKFPEIDKQYCSHPRWPLYQVAELLVRQKTLATKHYLPLVERQMANDLCPFEALIIGALMPSGAEISSSDEADAEGNDELDSASSNAKPFNVFSVIKVIFYIFLVAGALSRILHLFG